MLSMGNASAGRALLVVAWGLFLFAPPTALMAGPLTPVERADEPFGLSTSTVTAGTLLEKWRDVERKADDERRVLRSCEANRASCQSRTALEFMAMVDDARTLEGRARLGDINRAINLRIKQTSDQALYGAEDVWSPPLATLARGAGDCEDYAIAKFFALQEAGVATHDLRIVILRDHIRDEDHAVVAARLDGIWLMLDNLHMAMAEDGQLRNYYHPVFLIDHDGVKRYSGTPPEPEATRGNERVVGQIRH